MNLNLTTEEKNSIRVTFKNNCFIATYGDNNDHLGKYLTCYEMLIDFESGGIDKAKFDVMAHFVYEQGDDILIDYLEEHEIMNIYTAAYPDDIAAKIRKQSSWCFDSIRHGKPIDSATLVQV
jgi:hypothetical protein